MAQSNDKAIVAVMLVAMALAVFFIDPPWARFLVALVPALVLAQRVLRGGASAEDDEHSQERRSDSGLREQIQELLGLIREFYKTCHMVAVGQLEPSKAKAKAAEVEDKLNRMMARMLEKVDALQKDEEAEAGEAKS